LTGTSSPDRPEPLPAVFALPDGRESCFKKGFLPTSRDAFAFFHLL
jgi:hypothetical protein